MVTSQGRRLPPGTVRGRARITPEELERRKAHALELLRAGTPRAKVVGLAKLEGYWVKAIADANGIPYQTHKARARRVAPEVVAEREAKALALLRDGHARHVVARICKVSAGRVKQIAEAHGIEKLPQNVPKPAKPDGSMSGSILSLTHAELDALEARVAADRAAGILPPAL